jgi:hypothetical protein
VKDETVITIDRNSRVVIKKFVLRGGIRSAKIYVESGKIAVNVKASSGAGIPSTWRARRPLPVDRTVIEFAL